MKLWRETRWPGATLGDGYYWAEDADIARIFGRFKAREDCMLQRYDDSRGLMLFRLWVDKSRLLDMTTEAGKKLLAQTATRFEQLYGAEAVQELQQNNERRDLDAAVINFFRKTFNQAQHDGYFQGIRGTVMPIPGLRGANIVTQEDKPLFEIAGLQSGFRWGGQLEVCLWRPQDLAGVEVVDQFSLGDDPDA